MKLSNKFFYASFVFMFIACGFFIAPYNPIGWIFFGIQVFCVVGMFVSGQKGK